MSKRERLIMDQKWQFHLGDIEMNDCRHVFSKSLTGTKGPINPNHDDSQWQTVDLPHDFVLENGFSEDTRIIKDDFPLPMNDSADVATFSHGYVPSAVGWYRKRFSLRKQDAKKRIHLIFDGICRDAKFWLNGLYLDRHQSGYNECRMDVTDLLVYGNESAEGNVLAVRVDSRQSESWSYEGGGIYRHVWLEKTDPVAIDERGTFVWTKKVTGKASKRAELEVRHSLRNDTLETVSAEVTCTVLDANKNACAKTSQKVYLPSGPGNEMFRKMVVEKPQLWDIENPNLYTLVTEVFVEGKCCDRTETAFGIRTTKFDPDKGFFLNGKHVKLKGVCVHQNHAGVGSAIPDKLFEYRIQQLKKLGCNAYRCSHYPQAPELLDACDRLGMLVMAETRSFSSGPEFMRQHETMIRRDRNHPSIIIWSMANEEFIQNLPQGERMMQSIRRLVKRLDPTRPITSGNNEWEGWGKAAAKHLDLQGCNYRVHKFDWFHKKYPDKPLIGTENSLRHATRGIYERDPKRGYVDSYDRPDEEFYVNRIPTKEMWRIVADRPFVIGAFLWTGIDYKGEPKPYGWPAVSSNSGLLDSCCFPKDIAYYYKSWWNDDDDGVHIFPHWNLDGREGELIDVWCYSRCDSVELIVNGESCGTRTMPNLGHASWQVPYQPGYVEAHAYRGGKVVGTHRIETTEKAKEIVLETEHSTLWANGEDIAVVNISIVDQKGRLVPTACNFLEFEISENARIIGVGNGDPSCHEPDKATSRSAFNGLCQVIVQSTESAGEIVLHAKSKGLKKASLTIRARKGRIRKSIT